MACKVFAVLLCAGAGTRMGENKLALTFGGKSPLLRCYEAFLKSAAPPERIVVAASAQNRPAAIALGAADPRVHVVEGGATRGASVKNALAALADAGERDGIVAIHDAARCLVTPAVIDAAVQGAMEHGSGIAAIPMRDTVRKSNGEVIPREDLYMMQTPQAFAFDRILGAYEAAEKQGLIVTDDCAVYASAGYTPHFTAGDIMNQKLTYREDIPFFRTACGAGMPRVGFGEDTHVLAEGRRLILGGVDIPYEKGLFGHSDADVLTHAVMDALLGAAALGDIGVHFPDTEPRYAGADSIELLKHVAAILKENGFTPGNVDVTVVAQRPKLAPFNMRMRQTLAQAMGMPVSQVSIKATTSEGMNDEGAGKCITARAVCTVFSC